MKKRKAKLWGEKEKDQVEKREWKMRRIGTQLKKIANEDELRRNFPHLLKFFFSCFPARFFSFFVFGSFFFSSAFA